MSDFKLRAKGFSVEFSEDGDFLIHHKGRVVEIYPKGILEAIVYSFEDCQETEDRFRVLANHHCVNPESQKQIQRADQREERQELTDVLSKLTVSELKMLIAGIK